jgi:hypothetical protein
MRGQVTEGSTRRELLRRCSGVAAAGLLPASVARAASRSWSGPLRAADALRVDPRRFMPARQLRLWQDALDARGLRATGSPQHDAYVKSLATRLEQAGVRQVTSDPVPLKQWQPSRWKLEVPGRGSVPVAAYIPYSGQICQSPR